MAYKASYKELVQIAKKIETETVSVDVLAPKVKRASELITFCQTKLKIPEAEVNKSLLKWRQKSLFNLIILAKSIAFQRNHKLGYSNFFKTLQILDLRGFFIFTTSLKKYQISSGSGAYCLLC